MLYIFTVFFKYAPKKFLQRKYFIFNSVSTNFYLFCYYIIITVMIVCKFVIVIFKKNKLICLVLIKSVCWFYFFWCLFLCGDLFGRSYGIL